MSLFGMPHFFSDFLGGFPFAGAVAVSGLSSSEDIELATLALELIGAQKIP